MIGAQFPISCHLVSVDGFSGAVLVLTPVLAIVYWAPSLVAAVRSPDPGHIVLLNLVLGWTVVCWVVALVLAFRARRRSVAHSLP